MVGRLARGLDQFGDDMGGRGFVGIAHAEVDDVLAGPARLKAQLADQNNT